MYDGKYTMKSSSREDGMITAEYELTTHTRICTVFVIKKENAVKVKVIGKIKPGKTFGNVRDKNDICEIFRSFEKLAGIAGAK